MGPWGDAIMYELLPAIESQFRGIGEGWARFTYVLLRRRGKSPNQMISLFRICPYFYVDNCDWTSRYGGSTGGWEALAVQVLYPDEFNGCFAACPDPIDFRAYCLTDIYNDPNCYYTYVSACSSSSSSSSPSSPSSSPSDKNITQCGVKAPR